METREKDGLQFFMKGSIGINCFLAVERFREASPQSSYPGQSGSEQKKDSLKPS